MKTLYIGIVGSRRRNSPNDFEKLGKFLQKYLNEQEPDYDEFVFVSGGCNKGGDRFAERLAKLFGIKIIIHLPDFDKLPYDYTSFDYAQIAYERNTLIANDSDVLIALVAEDRKGGTEDTIKKFLKRKTREDLILL